MIDRLRCRDAGRVAGRAVVRINTEMIEGDTRKSRVIEGVMARRTVLGRRQMVQRFAERDIAVVAQRTVAGIDAGMVECCADKARGVVAIGAILAVRVGRNMIRELAHADYVVVASVTAACHAGVIVGSGRKSAGRMAVLAVLGANRHVLVERRTQRDTGRIDSVMAVVATLRQHGRIGVVNGERRNETLGTVAGSTIRRGVLVYWRIRRRCGVNAGRSIVA